MALESDSWIDLPLAAHEQRVEENTAKGMQVSALSLYHLGPLPVYACAMVKQPGATQHVHHLLKSGEWAAKVAQERKAGFAPVLVSASGAPGGLSLAAVFVHASDIAKNVRVESDLSPLQFKALNDTMQLSGMILRCLDAYGTLSAPQYVAVWWPNVQRTAWNCATVGATAKQTEAVFDGMRTHWARPALSVMAPGGRRTACYVDDQVGSWASRSGMSPAEFAGFRQAQEAAGRVAISLSVRSAGAGGVQRQVAAIYAERTVPHARSFRSRGANPQDKRHEGIDEVIRKIMVDEHIRGAALAIAEGTRLVYARGYTWAEPDYPEVTPRTLFRQGSVTKVFCGAAIWQLLAKGPKVLSLDDTLQSILDLKTPAGDPPLDKRFEDIKIRHLLEGTSGIFNQWVDVKAAQAFGLPLPSTIEQHARYVAGKKLTAKPGDATKAAYLNAAYRMLALVVAAKRKAPSIDAAFRKHVFAPLGMAHTRPAVTAWNAQPADHARHHITQLATSPGKRPLALTPSVSLMHRPLVSMAYGGEVHLENYVGSGGYSSSVVEMARFAAALSDRDDNPLMPFPEIQAWLDKAAQTTDGELVKSAHGYYGFDGVSVASGADGALEDRSYWAGKGGGLSGVGAALRCTTNGGRSYSFVVNTARPLAGKADWQALVDAVAREVDWRGKDLFPTYGMPSLSPRRIVTLPGKPLPDWLNQRFDRIDAGTDA